MSTYSQLYWLTRVDDIKCFLLVLVILFSMASFFILLYIMIEEPDDDTWVVRKHPLRWMICIISICSLFLMFVPSKKDIIFIVAGGKTIDFVKSDTSITKIPAQTTAIISDFLDKQLREMNKKDSE